MNNPLRSLLQCFAIVLGVAVALLAYNWSAVTNWQIRRDLLDYSEVIRHSGCSLAEKEELLDQVEAIEDCLEEGKGIGWLQWRDTNNVVRDLTQGGINSERARLLLREFIHLRKRLVRSVK